MGDRQRGIGAKLYSVIKHPFTSLCSQENRDGSVKGQEKNGVAQDLSEQRFSEKRLESKELNGKNKME